MLKVNMDVEGRDYIDYLVPFVVHAVKKLGTEPIENATVSRLLLEDFGLRVPNAGVEVVLRRLSKRGVLERRDRRFFAVAAIPDDDLDKRRAAAVRSQGAVVYGLQAFAKSKYAQDFSQARSVEALLGYLSRFAIACLRTFEQGTALPAGVHQEKETDSYVVNAFVQEIRDHDPQLFEAFLTLVRGHMLANALICSDLADVQRKFGKVVFYLDTPLVLRLFGLEGAPRQQAVLEVVDLVSKLNGQFAVFEHTAEEVHKVIAGAEAAFENPSARGHIVLEARRSGRTRSDLALMRAQLDRLYMAHGISRRPTPAYTPSFQIDETVLADAIDHDIAYYNDRAKQYDINSIRSIYSLRAGRAPVRLEDAIAVMVTSNNALARVAFQYGKNHEETREVSSVITDFSLANVAWLKAPLGSPDLPRLEIVASCFAAMQPKDALWSKYLDEIEKLRKLGDISPDDHQLLRYSLRAPQDLMDLTLGEEEDLRPATISQILERIHSDIDSKHLEDARKSAVAHEVSLNAAVQRSEVADQDANRHRAARLETIKRVYWFARSVGAFVSMCCLAGIVCVLAVSLVLSAAGIGPLALPNPYLKWLVVLIFGIAIVWGLANWIWGLTLRAMQAAIARNICKLALQLADRVLRLELASVIGGADRLIELERRSGETSRLSD